MINISPSALKTFLACPRSWYLQYVAKVDKVVPAYVTAGTALDVAVQNYLKYGTDSAGADGDDAVARELAVLKAELPAPKTVLVQERFRLPCPGYEGRVQITTGGLDYMTPPNAELMVIGDLKRIWHQDAALMSDEDHAKLSPEDAAERQRLSDDVQAQMYAWLLWQTHAPLEIIWRWTYCVRAVVSKEGKITRKAKAFSVDVKAERERVDSWFDSVVLQAARDMLDIVGPAEAVAHDPDSCENGGRCFVRAHCALHQGPVKGDIHVDLSRFKTNAAKAAEAIVEEGRRDGMSYAASERVAVELGLRPLLSKTTRDAALSAMAEAGAAAPIAINPPPLTVVSRETDTDTIDIDAIEASPEALAQLGIEQVPDTIPAPAPEEPKPRKRRAKAEPSGVVSVDEWRATEEARAAFETECNRLKAVLAASAPLADATTEAILDELRDRGYSAIYLERARG